MNVSLVCLGASDSDNDDDDNYAGERNRVGRQARDAEDIKRNEGLYLSFGSQELARLMNVALDTLGASDYDFDSDDDDDCKGEENREVYKGMQGSGEETLSKWSKGEEASISGGRARSHISTLGSGKFR